MTIYISNGGKRVTKICIYPKVGYQERLKLNDDKIERIIQKYLIIINSYQLKMPKNTEGFLIYLLTNMDQQGVLLQTIKAMSKNSGIKESNVQKILIHLKLVKLIYKKYGIVVVRNFDEIIEENEIKQRN